MRYFHMRVQCGDGGGRAVCRLEVWGRVVCEFMCVFVFRCVQVGRYACAHACVCEREIEKPRAHAYIRADACTYVVLDTEAHVYLLSPSSEVSRM